jgi:protein-tyrosine phosphatase
MSSANGFIEVEGCWNLRDAGGWPAANGQKMKPGLLYRSDDPVRLTEAGRATIDGLGLGGVIDLRQAAQFARSDPFIDETLTHHIPLVDQVITESQRGQMETPADLAGLYLSMHDRGREQIVAAAELIAATPESPWLVHCAAGKDRTGILVAALKSAIGVAPDDIVAEYALSDGPVRERRAMIIADPLPDDPDLSNSPMFLWTAPPEAMVAFLDLVADRYGGLEEWPLAMGISDGAIARLNEAWLS